MVVCTELIWGGRGGKGGLIMGNIFGRLSAYDGLFSSMQLHQTSLYVRYIE